MGPGAKQTATVYCGHSEERRARKWRRSLCLPPERTIPGKRSEDPRQLQFLHSIQDGCPRLMEMPIPRKVGSHPMTIPFCPDLYGEHNDQQNGNREESGSLLPSRGQAAFHRSLISKTYSVLTSFLSQHFLLPGHLPQGNRLAVWGATTCLQCFWISATL